MPPDSSILVVEDENSLRKLIVQMLSGGGYAAVDAESAEAGLAIFEKSPGDILLAVIDMVMPGMSGLDLAAELNRRRPDLKILYITGYVSSVAVQSVGRLVPECVLLKPFSEDELLTRIRGLLAG